MKHSSTPNPALISSSIFISGSMSWKSGWLQFEEPSMQEDISELLGKANHLIQSADTKEKVLELIKTYENALKISPKNREAIFGAGLYSLLIGVGYADKKEEKRTYYLKMITYFEQKMYLNQEFANLVDRGEKVWEACRVLSRDDLNDLFDYYLGIGMLWKECLSGVEKIFNLHWGARFKKMLKTMFEIDPTWGGGSPYYAWAGYYASAPRFFGNDMEKSEEYYMKAIELGPGMLNFRRTRALLLHTQNKNRDAFKKDLNWVLSQDPKEVQHYLTYPWNIFIQRNAQDMLDHIDEYF